MTPAVAPSIIFSPAARIPLESEWVIAVWLAAVLLAEKAQRASFTQLLRGASFVIALSTNAESSPPSSRDGWIILLFYWWCSMKTFWAAFVRLEPLISPEFWSLRSRKLSEWDLRACFNFENNAFGYWLRKLMALRMSFVSSWVADLPCRWWCNEWIGIGMCIVSKLTVSVRKCCNAPMSQIVKGTFLIQGNLRSIINNNWKKMKATNVINNKKSI